MFLKLNTNNTAHLQIYKHLILNQHVKYLMQTRISTARN